MRPDQRLRAEVHVDMLLLSPFAWLPGNGESNLQHESRSHIAAVDQVQPSFD